MVVPNETLDKLICAECGYYLSCGPVLIKHETGEAICGRCPQPEESVTQNKQYEAIAELLLFPCKYTDVGCSEKIPFSQNKHVHEEICNYRQRTCPITDCNWLGNWKQLLKHWEEIHPDNLMENPCNLKHDLSQSSLTNYLIAAFNLLFLIHTKVCCTSGNIFHAIRKLGETEEVTNFEYTLNIKRGREVVTKYGKVEPEGSLDMQENTALCLNINSLIQIFGGCNDIIFEIVLKNLHSKQECIESDSRLYDDDASESIISISEYAL